MDDFIVTHELVNVRVFEWLSSAELIIEIEGCDVMFKGNPSSDLFEYGISSLKIPEYMSLAKPILMLSDIDDSVMKANCGISVSSNCLESLVEKLKYVIQEDPSILDTWSINGWLYAKNNFVYEKSIEPLINWLEKEI